MAKKRLGVVALLFFMLLYTLPCTVLAAEAGRDVTSLVTVTGADITDRAGNSLAGERDISLGTLATLRYRLHLAGNGAIRGGDTARLALPAGLLASPAPTAGGEIALTLLDAEGNDTGVPVAYASTQQDSETLLLTFTDEALLHPEAEALLVLHCSFDKEIIVGGSHTLQLGTARQPLALPLHFEESPLRIDNTAEGFVLDNGHALVTWSIAVNPSEAALYNPTIADAAGEGQSLVGYRFAGFAQNETPDGWDVEQQDGVLVFSFNGLLDSAVAIEVTTRVDSPEGTGQEAAGSTLCWAAYNQATLEAEDADGAPLQPVASEAAAYLPLDGILESRTAFNTENNTVTWTLEINQAAHYLPNTVLELTPGEGLQFPPGTPILSGSYSSTAPEALHPTDENGALRYELGDLYGPTTLTFTLDIDLPGYFDDPQSPETTLQCSARLLWQGTAPEGGEDAPQARQTPEITAETAIYNQLVSVEAEWYSPATFTSWWNVTVNEPKRELEGEISVTASLLDGEYYHRLVHGSVKVTGENGQPLDEGDWTLQSNPADHSFTVTFRDGALQGQAATIRYETSVPRLLKTSKPGLFFTNNSFAYGPTVTLTTGGRQYTAMAAQTITRRAIEIDAAGYEAETQSLGWGVLVNPFALPRLGGLVVTNTLPEGTTLDGLAVYRAQAKNGDYGVYYADLAFTINDQEPLEQGQDYTLAYNEETRTLVVEIASNDGSAYYLQLNTRIENDYLAEEYDPAAFTITVTLLAERAMDLVTTSATQWVESESITE